MKTPLQGSHPVKMGRERLSAAAVQWGLSEMLQQRKYRLFTPVPDIPNSPHGKLKPDRKHRGEYSNPNWCFAALTWGEGVETEMEPGSKHKTDRNLTAMHLRPTAFRVKEHSGGVSL